MKLFGKKLWKDSRGLSIVEMICAVAILGAISTAIGGAMIVSATSYKNGTTETNLQQDVQFTAKVIEGLIVDATDTVTFDSTTKTLVITNLDYTHTITLDTSTHQLNYVCTDSTTGALVDNGDTVLATDVSDFDADVSNFAKSRNAQITIELLRDGREISSVYNVTSRNNPNASASVIVTQTASISCESEITLEPNQTDFELPVTVITTGGAVAGFNCNLVAEDDPSSNAVANGTSVKISIGSGEMGGADGKLMLVINTNAKDGAGLPLASKTVVVNIRRVLDFNMPSPVLSSGTAMKSGAVYQITATPTGTSLDKVVGAYYDTDYVNPYGATWSFAMTDGTDYNDYVEVLSSAESLAPYVRIKLKQDLPAGVGLSITATAKHPRGIVNSVQTNKTGIPYGNVFKTVTIKPSNFYLASEFLRGDDFVNLIELINWGKIKDEYGGNRPWRVIRYCPAKLNADGDIIALTGTWSEWQPLGDAGTPGFVAIRPNELNLLPTESYALEIKAQYGTDAGVITWPKADTPEEEYMFRFSVPAATVFFNYYTGGSSGMVTLPYGTDGIAFSDRIQMNRDQMYLFNITGDAGHVAKFFNTYMKFKLQRKTDTNYTNLDAGWVDASTEIGFMFPDQLKLKAPGTTGLYRLEFQWDSSWCISNWGTALTYADPDTGKGIIYFEVK